MGMYDDVCVNVTMFGLGWTLDLSRSHSQTAPGLIDHTSTTPKLLVWERTCIYIYIYANPTPGVKSKITCFDPVGFGSS